MYIIVDLIIASLDRACTKLHNNFASVGCIEDMNYLYHRAVATYFFLQCSMDFSLLITWCVIDVNEI